MRQRAGLVCFCVCAAAFALLSACAHSTLTQTFVNESDSTQTLSLTRQAGLIQPGNILFEVFGTDQLEGTYVLMEGDRKIQGKFTAGKDGGTQWIKFTADDRPEWRVKVVDGSLAGPGETTWSLKLADAKSAVNFKVGE